MSLYPVILAGGSGTRLWPLSKKNSPKQFLPLVSEQSLFQKTLQRLEGLDGVSNPVVVCNEKHRFFVMDQIETLSKSALAVILEPESRNTAPALTLAALKLSETISQESNDETIMLVMPSDHIIHDTQKFQNIVKRGTSLAAKGFFVTFGIVPDNPNTEYGYIQKGPEIETAYEVISFTEKPRLDLAKKYLKSGKYLWNSGIFMMSISAWLSALKQYNPDILMSCEKAHSNSDQDTYFCKPGNIDFIKCPNKSIDYAVMEKLASSVPNTDQKPTENSKSCIVIPLDVGWSDIGTWPSLWKESIKDENRNVVQGKVYTENTKESLIYSKNSTIFTVGLDNIIVIETEDSILIANKNSVEGIKKISNKTNSPSLTQHQTYTKTHRPWGTYEIICSGPEFQIKRIVINANSSISLQKHQHRSEHWLVIKGTGTVTRDKENFTLTDNESTFIPKGILHRLENNSEDNLEILEVQIGQYLDEDDIIRLDDKYHRNIEN